MKVDVGKIFCSHLVWINNEMLTDIFEGLLRRLCVITADLESKQRNFLEDILLVEEHLNASLHLKVW